MTAGEKEFHVIMARITPAMTGTIQVNNVKLCTYITLTRAININKYLKYIHINYKYIATYSHMCIYNII